MGKQDFLEKLRTALNGRVSAEIVTDNVRYYEDYINIEIRKGRSEEEVLAQLGDPRLLARTIIQTNGGLGEKERAADVSAHARTYRKHSADNYGEDSEDGRRKRFFNLHMPGGLYGFLTLLALICILVLVITVVFSVISIAFPILLIILAVSFVVKLFRDWIN